MVRGSQAELPDKNRSPSLLSKIQANRSERSQLGVLVLVTIGLNSLVLVNQLLLWNAYQQLARKAPPNLVQLEGGRTIATTPLDSQERTPAVIQRFVRDTLTMLLAVSGTLPGEPSMPDKGIEVPDTSGKRVTTIAQQASFGLSQDFRQTFLQALAHQTPQDVFRSGGMASERTAYVIQEVSSPQPLAPGQWKVIVVGSLIQQSSTHQVGHAIAFNREVFVRVVTPPDVSLYTTDLEREIAQIRQAGLEIYAIREFVPPNL